MVAGEFVVVVCVCIPASLSLQRLYAVCVCVRMYDTEGKERKVKENRVERGRQKPDGVVRCSLMQLEVWKCRAHLLSMDI